MAEDYDYQDGDVDEDFDQIEYRPEPRKGAAGLQGGDTLQQPDNNGSAPTSLNKRTRGPEEHHVDVTPGAGYNVSNGGFADPTGTNPDLQPSFDQGPPQPPYRNPYQDNPYQGAQPSSSICSTSQPMAKRAAGGAPGAQRALPAWGGHQLPAALANGDDAVSGWNSGAAGGGGGFNSNGAEGAYGHGGAEPQGDGAPAPLCQCSEPCQRRISSSAANPGRPFFKCARPQGEQCRFFKWEDELTGAGPGGAAGTQVGGGGATASGAFGSQFSVTPSPAGAGGSANGGWGAGSGGPNPYAVNPYQGGGALGTWGSGGGADPAAGGPGAGPGAAAGAGGEDVSDYVTVRCGCGLDCPVKTSNSANNPGRQFFACPKMREDPTRCGFFQWADGQQGNAGGGPGAGGGGGSGACFHCNQPGHFARDCPSRAAGAGGAPRGGYGGGSFSGGGGSFGGGGNGGGAAGGAPCYLCQQPGHWARDCPTKGGGGGGGRGGYGRGGGRGQLGGGPGQSFASRFGREGGGGGSSGFGGGGGGSKSGTCYKCGMPGHWSSSCPNAR